VPWPVYSERFFHRQDSTAWWYWTVPAGHRVVISSLTAVGDGVNTTYFFVTINAASLFWFPVQVAESSRVITTRQVAYAGEQLGFTMSRSKASLAVSGYLFAQPSGATADAPELVEGDPPGWYADLELD
jgi:hypothetical protein